MEIGKHSMETEETEKENTELGLHIISHGYEKEIETTVTKLVEGSLRSGKKIEFAGTLIILGDVNAGAEVIAEEHIIILGTLRGLAHAGAKGNRKAIIAAEEIDAMQIRIADIVKEIEKPLEQEDEEEPKEKKKNKKEDEEELEEDIDDYIKTKAYVSNGEIILE